MRKLLAWCAVALCLLGAAPALAEDLLEVHFINVASADCILLRMGEETMMIDSGRRSTSDRIFRYLEQIGVDHIDTAFLSHPHDDHLGGYIDLFAAMPIGRFVMPASFEGFPQSPAQALWTVLEETGIPVELVETETVLSFGGATVTLYQCPEAGPADNDQSMVALLRYGERSILFAADVENRGQLALAETYGDALRADILKMPHHGLAAYMREFHAAVQPEIATFSNTKSNIERTLKLTKQRGVACYLTTKGTLVATTDGTEWQIEQLPNEIQRK